MAETSLALFNVFFILSQTFGSTLIIIFFCHWKSFSPSFMCSLCLPFLPFDPDSIVIFPIHRMSFPLSCTFSLMLYLIRANYAAMSVSVRVRLKQDTAMSNTMALIRVLIASLHITISTILSAEISSCSYYPQCFQNLLFACVFSSVFSDVF